MNYTSEEYMNPFQDSLDQREMQDALEDGEI